LHTQKNVSICGWGGGGKRKEVASSPTPFKLGSKKQGGGEENLEALLLPSRRKFRMKGKGKGKLRGQRERGEIAAIIIPLYITSGEEGGRKSDMHRVVYPEIGKWRGEGEKRKKRRCALTTQCAFL